MVAQRAGWLVGWLVGGWFEGTRPQMVASGQERNQQTRQRGPEGTSRRRQEATTQGPSWAEKWRWQVQAIVVPPPPGSRPARCGPRSARTAAPAPPPLRQWRRGGREAPSAAVHAAGSWGLQLPQGNANRLCGPKSTKCVQRPAWPPPTHRATSTESDTRYERPPTQVGALNHALHVGVGQLAARADDGAPRPRGPAGWEQPASGASASAAAHA